MIGEAAGFVHVNYSKTGEAAGAALAKTLPTGEVAVITGALGRGDAEEMLRDSNAVSAMTVAS